MTDKSAQIATTGANISNVLKTTRLEGLKALDAKSDEVLTERPDIVNVQAITADQIVADFTQVKVSNDGKIIALDGSIMNAEAFKVAKGGKNYDTAFNITVLGDDKTIKLAKIQFTLVNDTVTAKVVKY